MNSLMLIITLCVVGGGPETRNGMKEPGLLGDSVSYIITNSLATVCITRGHPCYCQ